MVPIIRNLAIFARNSEDIMERTSAFTQEEKSEIFELNKVLRKSIEGKLLPTDYRFIKNQIEKAIAQGKMVRDNFS